MKKSERHDLIKRLIKEQKISNQEEFVLMLKARGVDVTQATISRDINELNLSKLTQEDGTFYYTLVNKEEEASKLRLEKLLEQSALKVDLMEKYLAIKTVPGSAVALGILLERALANVLFTSLTTDDKVLLIFKQEATAQLVADTLKEQVNR
ncbi:ArgR family transcriptional regulator [Vagococcus coleopterorum]|uniref:Arginine repressor n=1 Tax=Vagococcus coleopterorum TaxID=2714946 RepID=A0A6G8AKT6_9ENTE|nr:ArgR family transcriptional regulator [Vagococcus coleopterorum]QIL45590.1 ArgR family transcriptional regulator [Vagococcus coleopterorum]